MIKITPAEAIVSLEAVICTPDGESSIHGSKGDLAVIDAALPAIRRACNTHERLISVIQKIMDNDDAIIKDRRDEWDVNFEKPNRQEVEKLLAEARGEA